MPRQDGTGPQGMGAMTGRGLGPCGSGMRRGCCRGLGWRVRYATPITLTKEEEKKILKADLEDIDAEKEAVQKRLKEIN